MMRQTDILSAEMKEYISFFERFLVEEVPLFDRSASGVTYWHPVRFQFLHRIFVLKKWIQPYEPVSAQGSGLAGAGLSLVKNSLRNYWRRDGRPADMLVLKCPRRVRLKNRMIEPYVDLFLEKVPFPYVVWEAPHRWSHPDKENAGEGVFLDGLYLEAILKNAFHPPDWKSIRREVSFLSDFAGQFGVSVSRDFIGRLIRTAVLIETHFQAPVEARLRRNRVRLILMVNHYSPVHMIITSVAKRLGITVVELQHGSMCRYHEAYNFAHTRKLPALPDEIFTFGRAWHDMTRIGKNGVTLTTVGYPYLEERMKSLAPRKPDGITRILFVSQGLLAHVLGPLAMTLAKQCDPKKYKVMYKFHPWEFGHWKDQYPQGFSECGIELLESADLYGLFGACDVHIGVYSSALIESLRFGKTLILIESFGAHHFADLVVQKRAFFARNAEDVLRILKSLKEGVKAASDWTRYWEPDPLSKFSRRIAELTA